MANEATLQVETELPINMDCADGTGIEKGTLLKISGDWTVAAHSADEDDFAGIAAVEKIASDGTTSISVYRGGIFEMTAAGAITRGQSVALSGTANKVKAADASCTGSKIVGIALKSAATDGDKIFIDVRPGANNNAYA